MTESAKDTEGDGPTRGAKLQHCTRSREKRFALTGLVLLFVLGFSATCAPDQSASTPASNATSPERGPRDPLDQEYQLAHQSRVSAISTRARLLGVATQEADRHALRDEEEAFDGSLLILYELTYRTRNFSETQIRTNIRQLQDWLDEWKPAALSESLRNQYPKEVEAHQRCVNEFISHLKAYASKGHLLVP